MADARAQTDPDAAVLPAGVYHHPKTAGGFKKYEEKIDGEFLDAVYNDQMGKKVGISIAVDTDKNKNFDS